MATGRKRAPTGGVSIFQHIVERESNGEVTVRVTWNIMDEGRPNIDLLELVEGGKVFLCYFSSSYLGNRVPALDVLERQASSMGMTTFPPGSILRQGQNTIGQLTRAFDTGETAGQFQQ